MAYIHACVVGLWPGVVLNRLRHYARYVCVCFLYFLYAFCRLSKRKIAAICGCAGLHFYIVSRVVGCREAHHAFALQIVQERYVLQPCKRWPGEVRLL